MAFDVIRRAVHDVDTPAVGSKSFPSHNAQGSVCLRYTLQIFVTRTGWPFRPEISKELALGSRTFEFLELVHLGILRLPTRPLELLVEIRLFHCCEGCQRDCRIKFQQ